MFIIPDLRSFKTASSNAAITHRYKPLQANSHIFAVGRCRKVICADVVEVIPGLTGVTMEFLAARLAYKVITAAQLKK